MANVSLINLTIAETYDLLLVRNNSWSATGNEISLMNDSGVIQPSSFYIDPTNNRIGIGDAAPAYGLQVGTSTNDVTKTIASYNKANHSTTGGGSFKLISGPASDGVCINSDRLGIISFLGTDDGSGTLQTGANIGATADGTWTDSTYGHQTRLSFYTQSAATGTNALAAAAMTIDSTQYVGIGSSSPDAHLDIQDNTTSSATQGGSLRLSSVDPDDGALAVTHRLGVIEFAANENASNVLVGAKIQAVAYALWTPTSTYDHATNLEFYTQSGTAGTDNLTAPVMTLDRAGNLGIGTATPKEKLHLNQVDDVCSLDIARYETAGTISEDDILGRIRFQGSENGTSWDTGAYIQAKVALNTSGGANEWVTGSKAGTDLEFYTCPIDSSTPLQRLTILDSGNVGIGMATPAFGLMVGNATSAQMGLQRLDDSIANTNVMGTLLFRGSNADGVEDSDAHTGGKIRTVATQTWTDVNFGAQLEFYTAHNTSSSLDLRLTIKEDGDFIGSSSAGISDARLKTNVTSLTGSLDKINQLRGVSFTWKPEANKNTDKVYLGLLAQEVESYFPDVVRNESIRDVDAKDAVEAAEAVARVEAVEAVESKDAVLDGDGNVIEAAVAAVAAVEAIEPQEAIEAQDAIEAESYKSVEYSALIAPMIEAIKELSAKVTALENA
jgi:hypothetical protein